VYISKDLLLHSTDAGHFNFEVSLPI